MKNPGHMKRMLPIVIASLLLLAEGGPVGLPESSLLRRNSGRSPGLSCTVVAISANHLHTLKGRISSRWVSGRWNNLDAINQMLEAIRQSSLDGLQPEAYHLQRIEKLLKYNLTAGTIIPADLIHIDLLLSDAYVQLATHLANGKTDPKKTDPKWHAARRDRLAEQNIPLDSILRTGIITPSLYQLTPHHHDYLNLRKALVRYRKIKQQGGWEPFIPQSDKMEKGLSHPDVAKLRRRLSVERSTLQPDCLDENLFDQTLHEQVMAFQKRNSLIDDGVIGKLSIEALNVPVERRIQILEANLERWRWLTNDPGERYILVNIANFTLQLIDHNRCIFTTPAIVGRPLRETPVFSSLMTYVVFNPEWTVPPTILTEDVIPQVIENPAYLSGKQMKVLSLDGSEVDPATIDWNQAAQSGFPYMIRQKEGSFNSLGRIKFMFPNPYNVFIHDTPTRSLFLRNERTFSSGCIRIGSPFELAGLLLKDQPGLTPSVMRDIIDEGKPKTVFLHQPIPVHVVYLTAWADKEGLAGFGNDVYHRDEPLIRALSSW